MKFRVWDNENNKYFEPTYMAYAGKLEELVMKPNGRLAIRTMDEFIDESMFPNRFIVELSTGLKDSQRTEEHPEGQEIYEGEIAKDNYGRIFFIKFGEYGQSGCKDSSELGFFAYCAEKKYRNWGIRKDLIFWIRDAGLEVIGNIRENPELLEVPNEKNT